VISGATVLEPVTISFWSLLFWLQAARNSRAV